MTRVHQSSMSVRIHKIQMNQQSSPKNTIMAPSLGIPVYIHVRFSLLVSHMLMKTFLAVVW